MKSHLFIGTDLRNATKDTIDILGNREIIRINQDPNEGSSIAPFRIGAQDDFSEIEYNSTYPYVPIIAPAYLLLVRDRQVC